MIRGKNYNFMGFWNKKVINLEDKYFGMDLSASSIKVFQLEKKGKLDKVRSFNIVPMKEGCMKDGRILDKEKTAAAIKEAVKKSGPKKINTNKVICSLSESKVFLRIISVPKVSEDEIRESIKWEIEANIPLPAEQVYFDWQFLDQEKEKQNVLTAAVAKEVVDELMETLALSGLLVYGLEMESIAIARSLIPFNIPPSEVFLIVDMSADKTSFTIIKGNVPCFTSSIPFSSSGITEAIVSGLDVSQQEAEKIKADHGIEQSSESNSVLNSIKPFLENLSVEIEKTIDFYQGISKSTDKIEKIIIAGKGANLKGLSAYFSDRLKKQIMVGDPWINFNFGKKLPIINKEDSVRYATAIGLAMRGETYERR